jgi:hypothetical protein
MSFSDVYQFLGLVALPLNELRATLRKYKEKQKIKQQFADALEREAKEFEEVNIQLDMAVYTTIDLANDIKEEQPTITQILDFADVVYQTPRILSKLIISYIHIAKACKEISSQEGFMESLLSTNKYMYDFVKLMANAYIAKNTMKIDSNFFRFFRIHKSEISKRTKISKTNQKEIELLEEKLEKLVNGLSIELSKRHLRHKLIKKWQGSFVTLSEAAKDLKIEDVDYDILKELTPPELLKFAPFFDKSP